MAKKTRPGEPAEEVRHWLGEIASAKKREKDYRKDGEEVIEIYSGKCPDKIPFNILFSNVETLLPALFSQTPRPVVQRRFKDEDPLGKSASVAAQRMLEFLCDTNVEGYETFDQAMRYATLDGLLPGRGVTSVKYDAEIIEPEEGSDNIPVVKWEQVCPDSRGWDKVYFGYAKKWSKVPWLAYEEYLDKDECERLFGKDISSKIQYTKGEDEDEDEKGTGTGGADQDETGSRKTALIYQIWDRSGGNRVVYISPAYNDGYLKEEEDPLGLTGFFNCPRPLQFIEKSNDLLPVAMYKLYENQAKELNKITVRLGKVVEALKVRGLYDGALGADLGTLLEGTDNTLVPTDSASQLSTEKGLDNAIWFMPLEKLITVATNLVAAREQCKRVIYEITGVSDIIRGQSVASETLGAQKIKESWGTMRLKRLQKEVQRYSRDVLRIMLEIAASKFSVETWASATGLPFVTTAQKQQAQMVMQASQQQAQQQAMMAQQQGQPPQPPPPIDPQIQQALNAPEWEKVLELLKNDMQRAYRIDIETNSTIDVEATEDQKQIGDFMNAMGQLMAGLTPMVESGAMPFEASQSLLLAVVRRFRFGTEVEDHFKNMKAPQKGNPEAAAAQQEAQKVQQEMQVRQAEMQQEAQQNQQQMQFEMQKAQAEMTMEVKQAQMEAQMHLQIEQAKLQAQTQVDAAKLSSQRSIEQMKANIQKDTQLQMASLQAATQIEIAKINASVQAMTQERESEKAESEGAEKAEKDDQSSATMAAVMETQAKLLATLAAPKVGKLSNGKTIRIESEGVSQ